MRFCIRLLLNLIESPTADLRKSQAGNRYLGEQLNRRKGGGGEPDPPKDTAGVRSQSSDRSTLTEDAEFKGYDDVVVQELRIGADNVKFRKEKYYARARPAGRRSLTANAANSVRM